MVAKIPMEEQIVPRDQSVSRWQQQTATMISIDNQSFNYY
jgi:hypothetical protein